MNIRILIRNNETGEARWHEYPCDEEYLDGQEFMWTEGNYACDCNRELFWSEAGGEEDPDRECGHTRFSIIEAVREDGARLDVCDDDQTKP